ncbi:MAG TPA: hypothetical protein VHC96_11065 [Puia sp.]|jgi:hypothetical protein|nr:hypothetical protein [Puia sp.]
MRLLFRTGRRSVVRNRKVTTEKDRVEAGPTKASDIRPFRKTSYISLEARFLDICIALILLAVSSCSTTYQYVTLNSPEVPKNDKKEFSYENDSMRLTYNFHGEGGPVGMTVFNKMDKPLFVNWKKSFVIHDGQAVCLFNNRVEVKGVIDGYSYRGIVPGTRVTSGNLYATFDLPEGMDMIPPGSYITKSLQALVQPTPVYNTRFMENTRAEKVTDFSGVTYKYRRYSFDQSASPLQFKSYLTFVAGTNPQEFAVSHSFYAQEVYLSGEVPEYFGFYKPQGDQLFIRKTGE